MSIAVTIVADSRRGDMGVALARQVGAEVIHLDDGTLGCRGNHNQAWNWHANHPADWHVVLEDDAVPVPDFRSQLVDALAAAPTATASVVSLYLGSGYIDDWKVKHSIEKAQRVGADWLLTQGRVLSAVALAIPGNVIPQLQKGLASRKSHAIDSALSLWARGNAHHVAYAVPSLVDHADERSLATPLRRRGPRRALSVGVHECWSNKTMFMV